MRLDRLIGCDDGLPLESGGTEICGLTADSRDVAPGFLFAALPGTKMDGVRFVPQALEKGAAALLVADDAELPADLSVTVPIWRSKSPRRDLALAAARFYGRQPGIVAAVTGTNGKTSVASFLRQIWGYLGRPAASLGTLGIDTPAGPKPLGHTTPDPVRLHKALAELADEGVTHLAMEASSHGLDQFRLDGVNVVAAGYTNISRDHLDYHPSFEAYFEAKMRLFRDLLDANGVAVVNVDGARGRDVVEVAQDRGLRVMTVGIAGETIRLAEVVPHGAGQRLSLRWGEIERTVELPLMGSFQAGNALVAAGLAAASGEDPDAILNALEHLNGAPGRMEEVARAQNGAAIFVDYAHTPDALETVLVALRPHCAGRLIVVFGCGGDRDAGKRPLMGGVAAAHADIVYVTDDNPRSEDPAPIRAQIMAACPGGIEIGNRAVAIAAAVDRLHAGDLLLIAGKGHETGQIIGDRVVPFVDGEVAREAVAGRAPSMRGQA